ncbi:aspartate 1-decarboxylase [Dethiosulfovibrio peptidovorans DSM 11002]|uniref:Aspartate 1-decarboxylase n=1 Tax=Dethiosulfovibrio peptidovorans DSM 11002 TaxID=469381 RepID=D2Z6L1_9BACT|nr:aspartate 1-decarboxylase [Dethiosulfovibrio peptidovorans]EFC91108.1 aspartate 1-decarboxylase [Dethiosulfovibrio peptidovorans DSM 11002]
MFLQMLKCKLHGAIVTEANLEYQGSISIDRDFIDQAGFLIGEKVLVADMASGNRFETYVIEAPRGSGEICLNGAAARLGTVGDRVIVMAWCLMDVKEAASHRAKVVKIGPDGAVEKVFDMDRGDGNEL